MLKRSLSPTIHNGNTYSSSHTQSLSLSTLNFPLGGGNSSTGIMPSATDEVLKLRKEVKFADFKFSTYS